ncbi:hypothetical protein CYMTET_36444, partial [Cymbomonas tetramitiformis]
RRLPGLTRYSAGCRVERYSIACRAGVTAPSAGPGGASVACRARRYSRPPAGPQRYKRRLRLKHRACRARYSAACPGQRYSVACRAVSPAGPSVTELLAGPSMAPAGPSVAASPTCRARNEAQSMSAFKQSVTHLPHVLVPQVYQELTTSKVLTTGWINGVHLSEAPPRQMQNIVHIGLQCYLSQLLNTGFFHSDPHPGNLMVTPNGQLAILDYGSMTSVSSEMKYGLVDLLAHAFHQDYGALYTDMETIGLVEPGQDPNKIIPKLARLLHSTTDSQPLTSDLSAEIDYAGLAHQAVALILELELKLPPSLMGIFKAVTMLEGFALEVQP